MNSIRYYVEILSDEGEYKCYCNGRVTDALLESETKLNLGGAQRTLGGVAQDFIGYQMDNFDEREQLDLGQYLYAQLFGDTHPSQLRSGADHVELRIVTADEHIRRLPWALLAYQNEFLVASGWSVAFAPTREVVDCELSSLPRLLLVMPQPEGNWLPTQAERHLAELKARLAPIRIVIGSNEVSIYEEKKSLRVAVTWDDFVKEVVNFKPHLIYYYGHGKGDERSARLVFADTDGRALEKPLIDVASVLRNAMPIVKLAYINCCNGDAGGHLGSGGQLAGIIPAVVTNCTMARVDAAQKQGLIFWEHLLLLGAPPHLALAELRRDLSRPELGLSHADARWLTPVLYSRYDKWTYKSLRTDAVEPKRKSKLDRTRQFGQVQGQISDMLDDGRPRALSFVWYGQRGQGVRLFHERISLELRRKLRRDEVGFCSVNLSWPKHYHTDDSFAEMLNQALGTFTLGQVPEQLREVAGCPGRRKMLVYLEHPAVESDRVFSLNEMKRYLEWLDRQDDLFSDEHLFYVLGIPFLVEDLDTFERRLSRDVRQTLELNRTRLRPLDRLGAVTLDDVLDYFEEYHSNQRFSVRKATAQQIYERTQGRYRETVSAVLEAKFFALANGIAATADGED